jgi:hypothetical protein
VGRSSHFGAKKVWGIIFVCALAATGLATSLRNRPLLGISKGGTGQPMVKRIVAQQVLRKALRIGKH